MAASPRSRASHHHPQHHRPQYGRRSRLAAGRRTHASAGKDYPTFDKPHEAVASSRKFEIAAEPGVHAASRLFCPWKFRSKAQEGLDLLVIDYLQLMRSPSRRGQENRQVEVSEISAAIKALEVGVEGNPDVRASSRLRTVLTNRSRKQTSGSDGERMFFDLLMAAWQLTALPKGPRWRGI